MNLLDKPSELQAKLDNLRLVRNDELVKAMRPVQELLTEIGSRWKPILADVQAEIDETIATIRTDVLGVRTSLTGTHIAAYYVEGSVTWYGKKLLKYAADHPDVLKFKKVGKPYVQITAKEGKVKGTSDEDDTSEEAGQ